MNLNHVHLGTKNLDRFQGFYSQYFGFEKVYDHGAGAFLKNASGFLIAVDPVDEPPNLPSWYHLGFCLDNEAQVFDVYQKMVEGQVEIVREMRAEPGEFASFFVKDPDGYRLEISWHNE